MHVYKRYLHTYISLKGQHTHMHTNKNKYKIIPKLSYQMTFFLLVGEVDTKEKKKKTKKAIVCEHLFIYKIK